MGRTRLASGAQSLISGKSDRRKRFVATFKT
jgi:hypothetical protein